MSVLSGSSIFPAPCRQRLSWALRSLLLLGLLVDSSAFTQLRSDLNVDVRRRVLRERLDRGDARHGEFRPHSVDLQGSLDRSRRQATERLDRIADREPLPGDLRVRLRSLRSSMDALARSGERSDAALAIFLEAPTLGALKP